MSNKDRRYVEYLEEIAKQSTKVDVKPVKVKNKDVHAFIMENEIQAGESKIPAKLIYDTYLKWRPNKKKLTRNWFFHHFKNYFKRYHGGSEIFYMLDEDSFDMSYENWRRVVNDYYESKDGKVRQNALRKRKKTNKEKQKEKSGTEQKLQSEE